MQGGLLKGVGKLEDDIGFIIISRKIMQWKWYSDATIYKFFTSLIMCANYKDKEWNNQIIKRGSFVTSLAGLIEMFQMSKNSVIRCLSELVKTGEIIDEVKPNRYRIITIVNYELYQGVQKKNNSKDKQKNNLKDNKTNNSKDKQRDTTKQRNKVSIPLGIDTEKESSVVASKDAPPSQNDFYNSIDWHTIQVFSDDLKGKVWGFGIPYRVICKFARANGIDDYKAGHFHSLFEMSGTALPNNWEKIFYRYANADYETQDKFDKQMQNGEYKEKWNS